MTWSALACGSDRAFRRPSDAHPSVRPRLVPARDETRNGVTGLASNPSQSVEAPSGSADGERLDSGGGHGAAATTQLAADVLGTEPLLEAVLFVGGPPISAAQLGDVLGDVADEQIVRAAAQLNQRYHRQGRPYEIRRVGQGYQMVLRPQFGAIVRRVHGHSRVVRLSQAAVEVLSLVAYRQPVSAQQIDAMRGTDSSAILRQLRRRNLIDMVEQPEGGGRAAQFKTTHRFLELFHLNSLDDLLRVQDLDQAHRSPPAQPPNT